MKILKPNHLLRIVLSISLAILPVAPVLAQTAPTAPTAPTPPPSPESSEIPEAPEAPEAPVYGEPTPTPTISPTKVPTPTPTEVPLPVAEPQSTEGSSEPIGSIEVQSEPTGAVIDGQVGSAEIMTGDATVTAGATTTGNTNLSETSGGDDFSGAVLINEGNGSDSDNSIGLSENSSTTTIQDNVADVGNFMDLDSSTGDNSASKNVGDSTIITGDANVTGTLVNYLNTNLAGVQAYEFNILDDHNGDYILDFSTANCLVGCDSGSAYIANLDNGSGSVNEADLTRTTEVETYQTNVADLDNTMILSADSGNNNADNNTGGDSTIETGDANVSANVLNLTNTNVVGDLVYTVVNIFGDLVGDIVFTADQIYNLLANSGNGADSTNQISLTENFDSTTHQTNVAEIDNLVLVEATTGDNSASNNTGGNNSIETGDVNVDVNVVNIANTNIVGDAWLVLVNESGNWIGRIMGLDSNGNVATSENLQFSVDEQGGVTLVNAGNGSDSTNLINAADNYSETTVQTNLANVNNNLILSANTGGNSTSKNTGGNNSIVTGDANIVANIVNFVNTNIAGGSKLFVNVINVFGSWTGNFLTPWAEKDTASNLNNQTGGETTQQATVEANNQVFQGIEEETASSEPINQESPQPSAIGSVAGKILGKTIQFGEKQMMGTGIVEVEGSLESESLPAVATNSVEAASQVLGEVKEGLDINLAWLILLAPPMAAGFMVKRKLTGGR